MRTTPNGSERIRAAQRRRWQGLSAEQRSEQTLEARYAADTRWERAADPDQRLTPEQRAVAGAQLRDQHYRALGVTA